MQLFVAALLLGGPILPLVSAASRFVCGDVRDKETTPKYLRCKFEGSLENPKPVFTAKSSYEQCRNFCLVGEKCKAFSFSPSDSEPPESSSEGTCTTFRKRVVKQQSRKGNTGVYFWNRQCFDVDGYADSKPVINGDFQSGTLDPWTYDNPEVQIVEENNNNGGTDYSAQVRVECTAPDCPPGRQYYFKTLFQAEYLCGGTTYLASFDLLQPPGESNVGNDQFSGAEIFITDPAGATIARLGSALSSGTDQVDYTPGDGSEGTTTYTAGTVIHGSGTFTASQTGDHIFYLRAKVSTDEGNYITFRFDNVALQAMP